MVKVLESPKLLSYLGLASKARKLVSGADACEIAIKSGKAKIVLISGDAGENTTKHFSDMAQYRGLPCYQLSGDGLGSAIGYPARKTVCITDLGFAKAVINEINLNLGVTK
ncbi:MAG: ribosomal L7Ae/L30e/S12e/Gadd45 family protein [Clostridia bacterium]|nr:ribosomal L7Ae/L30e/S12e/Gadd45 family protein [Clostridia bacterium]